MYHLFPFWKEITEIKMITFPIFQVTNNGYFSSHVKGTYRAILLLLVKFYTCKDDWENLKGNERNEELKGVFAKNEGGV